MAAKAQIQVTGLKELRRDLRKFETDTAWKPALKSAYLTIARDVEAKAVASASNSRMGSRARGSIKGKGTTTNASIQAGAGVPYYGGFEFGSIRYRQFPPKREGGYHLYPTISENSDAISDQFLTEVDKALSAAQL
jgi:hypothetical protein